MYVCIYIYIHICVCTYFDTYACTVGFHNFNLRIFNLRVSNPNKLIVEVFLTRCRISMCQGLGPKKHDVISEIDRCPFPTAPARRRRRAPGPRVWLIISISHIYISLALSLSLYIYIYMYMYIYIYIYMAWACQLPRPRQAHLRARRRRRGGPARPGKRSTNYYY